MVHRKMVFIIIFFISIVIFNLIFFSACELKCKPHKCKSPFKWNKNKCKCECNVKGRCSAPKYWDKD